MNANDSVIAKAPLPTPTPRMDPRIRKILYVIVILAVVVSVAMWWIPSSFSLALESRSEGLAFTTTQPIDLVLKRVIAAELGGSDEPQIRLSPELVDINVDTAYVDFGASRPVNIEGSIAAQGIQHIEISSGCRVQLDPLRDSAIRVSVIGLTHGVEQPCSVQANLWSPADPGAAAMPSLLVAAATPTMSRPASIAFRPAQPLRLDGIPVSNVEFATSERSATPESSIITATMRFPQLDNRSLTIYPGDTVRIEGLRARLDLSLGAEIESSVRGEAERAYINGRGVSPNLLEMLQFHPLFTRVIAVLIAIIGAAASLYGLLKP